MSYYYFYFQAVAACAAPYQYTINPDVDPGGNCPASESTVVERSETAGEKSATAKISPKSLIPYFLDNVNGWLDIFYKMYAVQLL